MRIYEDGTPIKYPVELANSIMAEVKPMLMTTPRLQRKRIPDTVSELILLAVRDVRFQLRNNSKFTLDMATWIDIHYVNDDTQVKGCLACLAGACLMTSFPDTVQLAFEDEYDAPQLNFDYVGRHGLHALASTLNLLRTNDVVNGVWRYYKHKNHKQLQRSSLYAKRLLNWQKHVGVIQHTNMPGYNNTEAFLSSLVTLARFLKTLSL